MNILVTGGAGYIGSHICKALAKAGLQPVVYDNLCLGHRWAVKWGPLEEGDICDKARMCEALASHAIKAVIHCAGLISVNESVSHPEKYHRANVLGTQTLLEAMRKERVQHIVYSGSAAVYGTPLKQPVAEDAVKQPVSPYGENKLEGERLLAEFGKGGGLTWAALRYFNAAGADADAEIGEDHSPETHLIPLTLDAALGKRPHITVYGNDYDTPDGTCIRDYIHVTDLAAGHIAALRKLQQSGDSFAVNLGTGTGISVTEVIETARKVTGRPIKTTLAPRRAGDPPMLVADASKARELLQFKPVHSDISTLVASAWKWHMQHNAK